MGQRVSRKEFEWVYTEEPHATRRKVILAKHPEIKELMGSDPTMKWKVLILVTIQLASLFIIRNLSWPMIFLSSYFVGAINHSLTLAIHEISHNLAFGPKYPMRNRLLGIFANLPIFVPMSCSFKKYHIIHHRHQGEDGMDMDIPTEFEAQFFNNTFMKTVWLFFQPLFYSLRPLAKKPMPMNIYELLNLVVQLSFDLFIITVMGAKCSVYLILGTLLSMGIHPLAGHFISEHYMIKKGFETYSYYGILNLLTFNVGYHNEHHDFPSIPGCRLPEVRKIAPEFYDNLPSHTSWVQVLVDFIFDPKLGLYARVKRTPSKDS